MAEVAGEGAAAFWSLDGLCSENNLRLASKFKKVKPEERKAGGAGPIPVTSMDLPPEWPQHRDQQEAQGDAGTRSASLKDLCPEDKRRIANLIKELARVSEEKEVTEERLKIEHESFEKKIRHLEEQNNLIATEREALQQQYRECQELLSFYQKYLSEQQDKLNRSLSDLGARSVKPQQVPKIQPQPSEGELNGSYLGQCGKPGSDLESVSSLPVRPFCRSDLQCRCGLHCQTEAETFLRRKCCGAEVRDMHHPGTTQSHLSDRLLATCCLHRAPHSTPGRGQSEPLLTRPPDDRSFSRHSDMSGLSNGITAHVKDSAASERRKHELMLQKMELEVEKERLQQLLEQQEAKLLEKQQELLQTRLEPDPDRSLASIHTREAAVGTTPSLGTVLLSNGSAVSPVRGSSVGLPTPPSSKNGKKMCSPGGAYSGGKAPEIDTDHPRDKLLHHSTVCKGSLKDAATSPVAASLRSKIKSAKTSPDHKDAFRYETSLIDMLEAISPISSQRRHRPYTNPYDLIVLSPPPRGPSKPSQKTVLPGRQNPPTVDPEESRILEDIFFIC